MIQIVNDCYWKSFIRFGFVFGWCVLAPVSVGFAFQADDDEPKKPAANSAEEPAGKESERQDDSDPPTFDFLKIGQKAPAINGEHWLTDNNGLATKFKKFQRDKVYVIHFFITDNDYTTGLLPSFVKLQKEYEDKNVQVVAISFEDQETVEVFLDKDVPRSVKRDASLDSPETFFDLLTSLSTVSDPDRSIWNDYQNQSGRSSFSAFIIGKKGAIEWIGDPTEISEPLGQVVAGTWDRKKFGDQLTRQQEKIKQRTEMARQFTRWQRAQIVGRQDVGIDDLKQILADGFKDPENKSFKLLIQQTRLQLMMLTLDSDLPEVMTSYTDLVNDPDEGISLNNTAWEVYELYEAGEIEKNSELMQAAMYMAEKAIKLEPDSGAVNDTIAHFVYLLDGDLDKAIKYQKRALANAEGGRTEDLQPFLDFLLKEQKTGKKKSLQTDAENEDESDF